MTATRRSYLFLGGILGSMLSALLVLNLVNLFFRSSVLMSASLVSRRVCIVVCVLLAAGELLTREKPMLSPSSSRLFMFCGYVVFDTQMIIEKASMGDKDYLKHTLELFLGTPSLLVCGAFQSQLTNVCVLCIPQTSSRSSSASWSS
jgi:FtsH-binding integral membrane protein